MAESGRAGTLWNWDLGALHKPDPWKKPLHKPGTLEETFA